MSGCASSREPRPARARSAIGSSVGASGAARTDRIRDPAEVSKTNRRVDPLGHRDGLQPRGRAASLDGVVNLTCGQRRAKPAAPCRLERGHVEHAAVAVVVERHRGRDVLAGEPRPRGCATRSGRRRPAGRRARRGSAGTQSSPAARARRWANRPKPSPPLGALGRPAEALHRGPRTALRRHAVLGRDARRGQRAAAAPLPARTQRRGRHRPDHGGRLRWVRADLRDPGWPLASVRSSSTPCWRPLPCTWLSPAQLADAHRGEPPGRLRWLAISS
jgi:hypothetical protein